MKRRRWPALLLAASLVTGAAVIVMMALPDARVPLAPADCHPGPTTPGIDVSYHQDKIHWRRVAKAGIRFAFVRVSDGLTLRDPRFDQNWDEAGEARLLRGAYQYFRPAESAIAQADLLIAALRRDRGELPPVLDVEETGGKPPEELGRAVRTWVERVRSQLGVEPIIYASPAFWRDQVGGADLSSQPLWVAHYTDGCPRVPAPWQRWTFWQHSKTGRVPGIKNAVDLDLFAGSVDELRRRRPLGTAAIDPPSPE
jgi:lysozyme